MDALELSSLIKCQICNKVFENPIILPCGNSICHRDIFCQIVNAKYDCGFCDQQHQIPEHSFPRDDKTSKLIELNLALNLGENNYKAKKECEILEELISTSETLINDPNHHISDYFNCLKSKINMKRKEYISLIEEIYEKVIRDINKLESKCRAESKTKTLVFNENVQISKSKLDTWIKELKVPNFNKEKQWKNIVLKSKQETERIKYMLSNFQNDLLLYKDYMFQPRPIVNNNNFGDLYAENKEKIDEGRSEARFNLLINDFTSFIEKSEVRESAEWCVIKNIPWRLRAITQKTKDFQTALGFGFYPDIEMKKLKQHPINTEVKLRVVQKENCDLKKDLQLLRHFNHRFEKNQASGDPNFVLMREIMDPINGIYDEVNDSILLEAYVKVID